jgi:hypothetical protein
MSFVALLPLILVDVAMGTGIGGASTLLSTAEIIACLCAVCIRAKNLRGICFVQVLGRTDHGGAFAVLCTAGGVVNF